MNDSMNIPREKLEQWRAALSRLTDAVAHPDNVAIGRDALSSIEAELEQPQQPVHLTTHAGLASTGQGPLTREQLLAEFAKSYPQDSAMRALAENNSDFYLESIGARHHWKAFENGARAAERHYRSQEAESLLCEVAQFMSAAEQGWKLAGHWSEWDQSVVDRFRAYRATLRAAE